MSLHAKPFVFDRQRILIGSLNFDKRSERINTEIGLLIDSPMLAEQTARRFAAITSLANSYEVKLKSAPDALYPQLAWVTADHIKWSNAVPSRRAAPGSVWIDIDVAS